MKKLTTLLFLSMIFFISCSNPLNNAYKKDTVEDDLVTLKKSMSEDDFELLTGYIALSAFGDGSNMLGKTYGDVLKEAKELREEMQKKAKEEEELAAKAKIEDQERIKRLGKALTVSLFDKGFIKANYQEYLTYKFAFENKSDKDVKAFTGKVILNDLFDKEITNFSLTYDDGIKANSTAKWDAQTDYNQFMDKDVKLRNKDLEDIKITWIPEKIIYDDGTTLE
ncbi:MAG: hypothetical protein ACI94Y_003303 [Maribacter sp.]|jgi:hypothetical protein